MSNDNTEMTESDFKEEVAEICKDQRSRTLDGLLSAIRGTVIEITAKTFLDLVVSYEPSTILFYDRDGRSVYVFVHDGVVYRTTFEKGKETYL